MHIYKQIMCREQVHKKYRNYKTSVHPIIPSYVVTSKE